MSHCSLFELVLKPRAWVGLALMRGGALGLSGLLRSHAETGMWPDFSVVEFPKRHSWSSKAGQVAAGRRSDSERLPSLWFCT